MEASKPESFEVKTQLGRVRVKSMGADNDLGGYCCSVGRRVDDVKVESRVGRVDDAKLESRRRTFDPSKLVEGYQVIGRGTFSTVYKASYDGQEVVVKIPLLTSQESKSVQDSLKRAFDQEVSMWSRLDHPNIVKFIGASDDLEISNNVFYMVAEYLPRGTLNSFLARKYRSKLSLKAVIQLALDLARGLEYLHSENIVHRDVKPENLLLDNYGKLKIADFGVSRLLNSEQGEMTGQMGTFGFMAPEVLEKKKDYDAKCDVYSFGICLWMIYCCDIPYDRSNFADASSAIVHKGLRPHIPKCCPKSLAKIMKSCWSANPEERPDMKEVVSLLENIDTSKGGGMIREDQAQCSCFPMTKTRLKFFHRRSVK